MIVIAGIVIGVALGLFQARRRGGNRLDMAQFAAVYGIVFGLLGVFVTIIAERML